MTDTQTIQDIQQIRQRVKAIEAALMRTSELLDMVVLDQRKAHERMQKHAVRCDVSVTLDSGRQHKPLKNMAKPDMGSRFKAHEYYTKVNLDPWTGKRG